MHNAEKAQKGAEASAEKLKGEITLLEEKKKQAELAAKDAKEEAEKLRKQLAMASPYMTEFKTLLTQVQKSIVEMLGVVDRMESEEEKAKCKAVVAALAEKLKN